MPEDYFTITITNSKGDVTWKHPVSIPDHKFRWQCEETLKAIADAVMKFGFKIPLSKAERNAKSYELYEQKS